MAYNEKLTNRVREALVNVADVEEKRMFRGVTFMVDGKMCISVGDNRIMCRIDPDLHDDVVSKNGCSTVVMGGRKYKGYVYVHEDALQSKKEFNYWIHLALDYNKHAKATTKKRKK